jgi:hypothetical protein
MSQSGRKYIPYKRLLFKQYKEHLRLKNNQINQLKFLTSHQRSYDKYTYDKMPNVICH